MGGIADYCARLAAHLATRGVSVTIVTGPTSELSERLPTADGPHVEVRRVSGWGIGCAGELAEIVRAGRADLVHLQYQPAAYQLSGAINLLPLLLRSAGARTGFVTTLHDLRPPYLFPKAGPLRAAAVHVLIGSSDGVICVDPGDVARIGPRARVAWVPVAAAISPASEPRREVQRARLGLSPEEVALGFFGFANASKGLDTLLLAFARLLRSGLDARLVLIGDEIGASDPSNLREAARLRELGAALGLEERIVRTGSLPEEDVSAALDALDVAALPFADGVSLRRTTLLTCFNHGLPVVTTRGRPWPRPRPEICVAPFEDPEAFRVDERVAVLVAPGDDAALAREIYRLVQDPQRGARLGSAARALSDRLSWDRVADAHLEVYRRALS
jgi:glycosyltransferase involved in cell wall biosynthesis